MRSVTLIDGETFKIREVLKEVVRVNPQGSDLEEVRKRIAVLKKIKLLAIEAKNYGIGERRVHHLEECPAAWKVAGSRRGTPGGHRRHQRRQGRNVGQCGAGSWEFALVKNG